MTSGSQRFGYHGDFRKLWAGQTVSAFGTLLGALSLTALVYLDASPPQLGLLYMAQGAPALAFSLFAGVWVDRLPRRVLLIASDVGRAVALLSVPLAAAFGELRIEQLYIVAFVTGTLDVAFRLAYRAYLPSLVEQDQLIEANSRLAASESVAEAASPAVGGALVQAAGVPIAVFVDALTFAGSALMIALIRRPETRQPRKPESSLTTEIVEGVRVLWRNLVLRALAADICLLSFFGGFYHALYGAFLLRTLDFSPLVLGLTIGAGGVGSFLGALIVGRLLRRLGLGRGIIAARIVHEACTFLIPVAGGPPELAFGMIVFAQLAGDAFWVTADVSAISLRQTIVPEHLLGRVNAGMHTLEGGCLPLGALLAGFLAEAIGLRETLFIGASGMICGIAFLALSPLPRLQTASDAGDQT